MSITTNVYCRCYSFSVSPTTLKVKLLQFRKGAHADVSVIYSNNNRQFNFVVFLC